MTRRYLITGAQGLIGRYLTARILEDEPDSEIVGIGRSERLDGVFTHSVSAGERRVPAPVPEALRIAIQDARFRYERLPLGDTLSLRALIRELQPHCIFHLASGLHTAPEEALIETNLEGTRSLLNAVLEAQGAQARVVLGSSGSVYGEPVSLPIRESHPCRPAELYGMTKLAAEHLARVKAAQGGFTWMAARIFNVVGPGQSESHVCARFAAQISALSEGDPRKLEVGTLETTRDFVDVRDVATALRTLAWKGEHDGAYNVASGQETSIRQILEELLRESGLADQVELVRRKDRAAGVSRHVADTSRLQALGFSPRFTLRESLRDLFQYYRALEAPELNRPAV